LSGVLGVGRGRPGRGGAEGVGGGGGAIKENGGRGRKVGVPAGGGRCEGEACAATQCKIQIFRDTFVKRICLSLAMTQTPGRIMTSWGHAIRRVMVLGSTAAIQSNQ